MMLNDSEYLLSIVVNIYLVLLDVNSNLCSMLTYDQALLAGSGLFGLAIWQCLSVQSWLILHEADDTPALGPDSNGFKLL